MLNWQDWAHDEKYREYLRNWVSSPDFIEEKDEPRQSHTILKRITRVFMKRFGTRVADKRGEEENG